MNQQYPSILLEKAVGEFSKLPGIGRKTAMRLVLHLLRQDTATVEAFGNSIITLKREVKYCKVCHNISDTETCQICANPQRDASTVCVVENIRDVMAVEATPAVSRALSRFWEESFLQWTESDRMTFKLKAWCSGWLKVESKKLFWH